jgi:catechol 2,3-dioxygenase-like lactoylglutathione lyase family enzyme
MVSRRLAISSALLSAIALLSAPVLCREGAAAPPPANAALTWNSPVLLVEDLDEAVSWYAQALGFEKVGERIDGTSRMLILSRGMTVLSLRPSVETTGSVARGPSRLRPDLTLLVDDVDAEVARLQDEGVTVLSWPEDDSQARDRLALIADPYGNRIVLREPLPPGS